MKLMIVESPNKVKKIEAILGEGWKVAASVGHIRDLPTDRQGVCAPDFVPEYVFTDKGEEVVSRLKRLANTSEEVYLASDPDREGEAIAWHLKEALALKHYHRVRFDAISPDVIQKALANSTQIDEQRVRAQEARRVVDRLVGWMVSPVLGNVSGTSGLSAGRVQSPAVRLVVERERAIQLFKVTNHFGARVSFGDWSADWDVKPYLKADDEYLMDEALATEAAAQRAFTVIAADSKTAQSAPPAPFRSATLMQAASVEFSFAPAKTMDLAQKLFAAGHINYHRTDKQNFVEETNAMIRAFALSKDLPIADKIRKWKSVEGAQEGHEAIRPIHLELETAGDTDDERKLYALIWRRAIASQLADAEYKVNTLELQATSEAGRDFVFKARGRVLIKQGWKCLMAKDSADEDAEDESISPNGAVPLLAIREAATAESGKLLAKKTQPPKRYTQATLIKKLEDMGIGRPSTYPAIMKTIIDRGYIVEEGRMLRPTQRGMMVVVSLVKAKCEFINYGFTADMEVALDKIAMGEADYRAVVADSYAHLQSDCARLNAEAQANPQHPCPKCKAPMRRIENKEKGTAFWGCTKYKETGCEGALPDDHGKPGKPGPVLSKFLCRCKKPLVHKVKAGEWDFWSCSGYPDCKQSYKNKNGKPVYEK